MAKRRRATLRSLWWQRFFKSFRYCTHCAGPLKRTYVREENARRHKCQNCGQITYINPKVVAGLIPVTAQGRVLLLRRAIEPALGYWTYPAGFQEMGETVEQAAIRETWEESGVRVRIQQLVGIYSYPDAGVVTLVYAGRLAKGQKPKITSEALEVKTFDPGAIPWKSLAFRSTKDALKDWIKHGKPYSNVIAYLIGPALDFL